MVNQNSITGAEVQTSLDRLDAIARAEYGEGCGLSSLLRHRSPDTALRLQRIVGIVLKQPFAQASDPPPYSRTGARHSWPWRGDTPADFAAEAPAEFAILDELRRPGPWNEVKPYAMAENDNRSPITWDQFKSDADTERGLFKILALYVNDRLSKRGGRSLREYLGAEESLRFEAGLDVATLLVDTAVLSPLAAMLGIPTLAVGLTLVGIQYGWRTMTDTNADRVGDSYS